MEQVTYDYQNIIGEDDPDLVLSAITGISQHQDVVTSHKKWEEIDQQWKDAQKGGAPYYEVLKLAALTRESMKVKDAIHDAAADIACEIAENSGTLIDYQKETLGTAKIVDDVPELSAAWHNLRRQGFGGSTISKILGFHWKTRNGDPVMIDHNEREEMVTDLAIEKMTKVLDAKPPQHGVLYRGHQWEPVSLVWLALTHGVKVAVSKSTWQGVHPLQIINVDGIILDDDGNPEGIVECKTSSRTWTWQWGVPTHYRAQVLWYLNATGLDYAQLVVRFDDGSFDLHTIYADETVDGTESTKQITSDRYMEIIENTWEEVQEYRKDLDKLWVRSHRLFTEMQSIENFTEEDGKERFVNDHFLDLVEDPDSYTVVKLDLKAPYERMDKAFTIPVSIATNGNATEIPHGLYPAYPSRSKGKESNSVEKVLASVKGKTLVAQDDVTYRYLADQYDLDNMIHISALARYVDLQPGRPDFVSYDEVVSWIEEFFD